MINLYFNPSWYGNLPEMETFLGWKPSGDAGQYNCKKMSYIRVCVYFSIFCVVLNWVVSIPVSDALWWFLLLEGRINSCLSMLVFFFVLHYCIDSFLLCFDFSLPFLHLPPKSFVLIIQRPLLVLFWLFKNQELFFKLFPLLLADFCSRFFVSDWSWTQ